MPGFGGSPVNKNTFDFNMNNTPTVREFRQSGYQVRVDHKRAWKTSYVDFETRKIVTEVVYKTPREMVNSDFDGEVLIELLPRSGKTEVTVFDPNSGLDFFADATCRDDENYNKKIGTKKCLERISDLIRVCNYSNQDRRIEKIASFIDS